ncbi:self-incompatibility family protein [Salix suchowensis]|nr:self-incompatibility family protein [Salix suchowensis]
MISLTIHFVQLRILSLLLLLLIITTCDAGCLWKPTRLHITNELGPGLDLPIHCKSRNDDLGHHIIRVRKQGLDQLIHLCKHKSSDTMLRLVEE